MFLVPQNIQEYKDSYDKYFSDLGFALAIVSRGI